MRAAAQREGAGDARVAARDPEPDLEPSSNPAPIDGLGAWPGPDDLVWTNIVDRGDVVDWRRSLRCRFGDRVHNVVVHNGSHAHDAAAYLTDRLAGAAIAGGLGER